MRAIEDFVVDNPWPSEKIWIHQILAFEHTIAKFSFKYNFDYEFFYSFSANYLDYNVWDVSVVFWSGCFNEKKFQIKKKT